MCFIYEENKYLEIEQYTLANIARMYTVTVLQNFVRFE